MGKIRHIIAIVLLMIFISMIFSSCNVKKSEEGIQSLEELNKEGIKIAVAADTAEYKLVEEKLPKAQTVYFSDEMAAYTSVSQGKVDAFVFSKVCQQVAINNGVKGVRFLDENLGESIYSGVGISPVSKIPDLKDKLNGFIKEVKENGTLDDMQKRWIAEGNYSMPDIPEAENPSVHLTVGTAGSNVPFTFYKGTELTGYEIELAKRFALWLGASIEFKVYNYEGIIAAAQGGDVDCIFSNLFITPERLESLEFSDPTFVTETGVLVRDESSIKYSSLQDFADKRIGVLTGAIQGPAVEKMLPEAELAYFNTHADVLTALRQGKIDAFADSSVTIRYLIAENEDLEYLAEDLQEPVNIGAIFTKSENGDKLRSEFNTYLAEIKKNGRLEELDKIWFGKDEEKKTVKNPYELPATNGTLKMATDLGTPPVAYINDIQIAGLDMNIAIDFCQQYGYGLEIVDMAFNGIIDAVASGKFDFALCNIAITDERAESVNFSDTIYSGTSYLAYLDDDASASTGFWDGLKESFYKTFIRENRWLLFVSGIVTTLIITCFSILAGTLLGFGVFMLCRKTGKIANDITRFCVWIIQGMPVVVLLMIMYYIVFGNLTISGTAVSVVAFTLIFAAAVFNMLKGGVTAVGKGQLEAAYSLGYSDTKAFFKIILPQALPHIMPNYKGQIVALIKATAVVGYVAVQDLTKMGDIVRSRTFEAFFPLIAIAIIYFILAGILTGIVKKIEINTNPRRKRRDDRLKEGKSK